MSILTTIRSPNHVLFRIGLAVEPEHEHRWHGRPFPLTKMWVGNIWWRARRIARGTREEGCTQGMSLMPWQVCRGLTYLLFSESVRLWTSWRTWFGGGNYGSVSWVFVCLVVGQVSNIALLIISDWISNLPRGWCTVHPSLSSLYVLCRCVFLYISTCTPQKHLQTFIVRDTRQLWNSIELELVFLSFQRWEPARSRWWQVRGWRVIIAGAVIRLSFTPTS